VLSSVNAGNGIKATLIVQGIIALFLVSSDLDFRRFLANDIHNPLPTGPVTPGDQVREYLPTRSIPTFVEVQDAPSIAVPDQVPSRLNFSTIETAESERVLLINGEVSEGDHLRFVEYLETLDEAVDVVAFNSPGGLVAEALKIGRRLREMNATTMMFPGMFCFSSCPYMLAGGEQRIVSIGAAVGLHQHYYAENAYLPAFLAVEGIQLGQGETLEYLLEMGIEPAVLVYALKTPPDEIYVLVESELLDTKMATKLLN